MKAEFPEVRRMTRKQLKELRAAGLDPALLEDDQITGVTTANFVDWILDNVYEDVDFDNFPNDECVGLAAETYRIAQGGETKNS